MVGRREKTEKVEIAAHVRVREGRMAGGQECHIGLKIGACIHTAGQSTRFPSTRYDATRRVWPLDLLGVLGLSLKRVAKAQLPPS